MDGIEKLKRGSESALAVESATSSPSVEISPRTSRLQRTQTVCSSHPLRHKDKRITKEKRERFEALDLDVLLYEFKAVAATVQEKVGDDEDEPEAENDGRPGADEIEWLREAGFPSLVDTHLAGRKISEAEIHGVTQVLSTEMAATVTKRVSVLNLLLPGGEKSSSDSTAGKSAPLDIPARPSPDVGNEASGAANSPLSAKTPPRDVYAGAGSPLTRQMTSPSAGVMTPARSMTSTESMSRLNDVPTRFDDLGDGDKSQIQYLNVVHLTTILESKKLFKIAKRVKKKKMKKGTEVNTFGVNLEHMVERDRRERPHQMIQPEVPVLLSRIINFLRENALGEEGVFRKAGHVGRIRDLRTRCEETHGEVDFAGSRPHDVAALLKQFLRETPEPLLTSQYIETFYTTERLQDPAERLRARKLLAMLLPPVHRACLKLLLDFLCEVAANDSKNKMGIANLSVVFAPSLFFIRGQKGARILKEVEIQVHTASTLRGLLENADALWDVPKEILKQLRHLNESSKGQRKASNAKDVQKLLKKVRGQLTGGPRTTERLIWVEGDSGKPPVRAKVKVSWNGGEKQVDVTDTTTVSDVLQSVGQDDGHSYLEERGGNIESRRLNPRAYFLPVLKANSEGRIWASR